MSTPTPRTRPLQLLEPAGRPMALSALAGLLLRLHARPAVRPVAAPAEQPAAQPAAVQ